MDAIAARLKESARVEMENVSQDARVINVKISTIK
jgi:hypothetical protein